MNARIISRCLCLVLAVLAGLDGISIAFAQSAPTLAIRLTNNTARLTITADAGSYGLIQSVTNLSATNQWVTLTNYTLLSSSLSFVDTNNPAKGRRFYRVFIPLQTNMLWVPAGAFVMGSPTNEIGRVSTAETQHTVTISRGFYMGKFQVTQTNYLTLMLTNPSWFKTNATTLNWPVEQVAWSDATNYCGKLTQQEQAAGRIRTNWIYRLPTEAEWEYACRSGTTNAFYLGPNLTSGLANFDGEYEYISGTGTVFNSTGVFLNHPVNGGGYSANNRGLYDMAGNVWEWCQDWFTNYTASAVTNPPGPVTGTQRVFRGGAFNATGAQCRSANRNKADPATAVNTIGFRVVLSAQ